jgi:hypothetical protein
MHEELVVLVQYMRGGRATLRSTYNRLQRIFELRENNVRPRKQSVHGDETKAIQSNSTKCKKTKTAREQ